MRYKEKGLRNAPLWRSQREDQGLTYLRLIVCLPRDEFEILGKIDLSAQWEEKVSWGDQMLVYPKLAVCLSRDEFELVYLMLTMYLPRDEFEILGNASLSV